MKNFLTCGGDYKYFVDGSYIPSVDSYNVSIYTSYGGAKRPDDLQRVLNLGLDRDALDTLIAELEKIRDSDIPV